jgi:catechol 2,3-dioxygenase-like lactoylglutathione lyase family enzyme
MAARIQHVSIPRPPDTEDEARAFYGGALGLEEIPPPRSLAGQDLIWYRLGDTEIHILVEDLSVQDRSGRHFCIAVPDVDDLRQRFAEAGIAVVGTTPIPGRPRYFVRDPFGNLIEVTTIEGDYRSLEDG